MTPKPGRRTTPDRTCIGCRSKAPTDELIRLAIGELAGTAELSETKKPPGATVVVGGATGRGAWLCRATTLVCFDRAIATRAFGRAFRQRVDDLSLAGVRAQLSVVHSDEDARLSDGPFPS